MTFRANCPNCKNPVIIKASRDNAKDIPNAFFKVLYGHCTNTDCCAVTRYNVTSDGYVNPPRQTTAEMAAGYLNALPNDERQAALDLIQLK